jgi:hypothetical protein
MLSDFEQSRGKTDHAGTRLCLLLVVRSERRSR